MGEQLEALNLKELQQLEHQLEISLKHIRSRKVILVTFANVKMKVNLSDNEVIKADGFVMVHLERIQREL